MANKHPKPPTKKQMIAFEVLLGEREYQDETHGEPFKEGSIVDFANLLIEYTDKLAVDVTVDPNSASPAGGPLKRLREVAAIALHAMEVHGIQPRENHVPMSAGVTGTANIVAKSDTTAPKPAPAAVPAAVPAAHHEGRVMAPPPAQQTAPPHTAFVAAEPITPHHEAVELPHHPPGEEHGKK